MKGFPTDPFHLAIDFSSFETMRKCEANYDKWRYEDDSDGCNVVMSEPWLSRGVWIVRIDAVGVVRATGFHQSLIITTKTVLLSHIRWAISCRQDKSGILIAIYSFGARCSRRGSGLWRNIVWVTFWGEIGQSVCRRVWECHLNWLVTYFRTV